MAIRTGTTALRDVRTLFELGTIGSLSDEQLVRRFAGPRDEAAEMAFAVLVERHGPMVLRVCRSVLRNAHDAQDAFQATFLVLARRANSLWVRDSLGPWLHAVALRAAACAKGASTRRRTYERRAAELAVGVCVGTGAESDITAILHEEISQLPQRYQAPVVFCHLEGLTHDQAARQLGCPVGTVRSRLARGRDRLRHRLVRRGLATAVAVATVETSLEASAAAIPTALVESAQRAALAGGPTGTVAASAAAASLAKGVLHTMWVAKLKWIVAAIAAVGILTAGMGVMARLAPAHQGTDTSERTSPATRAGFTREIALKTEPAANSAARPTKAIGKQPERFSLLKNGLNVLLRPVEGAKQTALVTLYSVGGDHDPAGRSGLAHMIEHLYVTAAAGVESARAVDAYVQRYPEGWNAQTGDRYTVIATVFPEKDLERELRDAAARMGDLRVTAGDLQRERERLLEELENMFTRVPTLAALNNARELVRPSPRGGRRGGHPEQVRAITVDDVRAHWERYYKPQNALVVVSGAFDPDAARRAITAQFAAVPAGDKIPAPGEPGLPKLGTIREVAVRALDPAAGPQASVAYSAPQPGGDLYAPFLVLVARLWENMSKLGGGPGQAPVHFSVLDDPAFIALTVPAEKGESAAKAIARLDAFVATTLTPALGGDERANVQQTFGFFLGTADIPDATLGNIYGLAFTLGRREQLRLDPAKLNRALESVSENDLRRATRDVFGPDHRAGVLVTPAN